MRRNVLIALAATLAPVPALAQAYQCTLPHTVAPIRPVAPDGPVRKLPVAGYTLAASWSPDYCKMSGDTTSMQCSRRNGRFGFILHGLWPEAARGPAPQWCATRPLPTPEVVRRNLCMTPSPGLLAHEWAKHGSCMTKRPATYFKVSAILWRSIRWPDADRLSRHKDLTAGDLRKAFVARNPDWKREYVGLDVSRAGWLREIRLCYGKDFMPKACSKWQFGPADSAPLKIWRGL
ncbi:ribonuclease T2 family protein [Novosphingobium mangrovi (ex Huang et al. 2023)]|uniref:Ribonuclease T n=1 Tax=Novosphingobium mangrovi (ex Huang et al. 2023) TaxID=2976432 RepID=A0ABT2I954_9SPHN|nr:ribonuclease T [Novosphingobium mangrovi (ex Huang et al. 2023)]MCT2401343.1 ribonuclease T [Novosphingobium mangrovi (ex Huang et al. 2023)]